MWMVESKRREAWDHTSALLALLANAHRDPKKGRAFRPEDFHPCVAPRKQGLRLTADKIGLLSDLWVRKKRGARQRRAGV
jgi:hypothetical protein